MFQEFSNRGVFAIIMVGERVTAVNFHLESKDSLFIVAFDRICVTKMKFLNIE